jgi:hypothetical protein
MVQSKRKVYDVKYVSLEKYIIQQTQLSLNENRKKGYLERGKYLV